MIKHWILAGIIVVFALYLKKKEQENFTNKVSETSITDYTGQYKARKLLTKREWTAHRILKPIADKNNLILCPKVRLLDIIEPNNQKMEKALRAKVIQKHVDFVVCDTSMNIIGVLEIDDSTHDRLDRQERDMFVDSILTDVGYIVVHTRIINDETLNPFIK